MSIDKITVNQDAEKEPIAIIGIGCRFPGSINSPESFWQFLCDEGDAITKIPSDRFDVEAFYHPAPSTPGKIIAREGGFLEAIDLFDAYFFGMSPREAERVDPQQRLLLEMAWEALEDAGQNADKLYGSLTGVFVGLWRSDYEAKLFADPANVDFYASLGCGNYSASGRISYTLGLQGPSITVNTHFSSSLVAVHLGCQSLWSGESKCVLAGGVNIILQPHISIAYSQSQMIAPDGRCKFGDARANGTIRSEGAGLVVLKPLSEAIADGDSIYAVIRGSAVSHDGRSGGFLATPGRQGQELLLRRAYEDANVLPSQAQYIEAHGTGTRKGDSVELQALGSVMSTGRSQKQPCIVGSVKTNFGHTETAAGIAGLIKVVLSLKHRVIPASLHVKELSPDIDWQELQLMIQTEATTWPDNVETAVAGVSSFGIAGTNAHVVLSEAPPTIPGPQFPKEHKKIGLLPLSAHTPQALVETVHLYKELIAQEGGAPLEEFCYSASCHRTHLTHRLALVAGSRAEMIEQLDTYVRGEIDPPTQVNLHVPDLQRKIVFVFSGQGSQWIGMGRQLMEQEAVFRQSVEHCEHAMQPFVDWSLVEQLMATEKSSTYRLNEIDVIQPTLFCIQIALAALWRSWGIEPDAVIGHSMGEVTAAYIAGALTLEDAMRVICYRSQQMRKKSGQGAMSIVELSLEETQVVLAGYEDSLSIASSNSPRSTIVSGNPAALDEVLKTLQQQDIFCSLIKVDVASHSPQMDPLKSALVKELEGLQPRAGSIPIYSTTLGMVTDGSNCDATHWGHNLRQPVLLSDMVQQLLSDEYDVFIEISPHPILLIAIQQGIQMANRDAVTLASMRRNETEQSTILNSLADLYMLGYTVDWNLIYPAGGLRTRLPRYPWQRERFWFDPLRIEDDNLHEKRQDPASEPSILIHSNIRDELLAKKPGQHRQSILESHLREQVARVLRLTPSTIPLDRPLKTLGLDSLMSLEFRNRLEISLGLTLSATLIWNYPTITKLVPVLAEKMFIPMQNDDLKEEGDTCEAESEKTITTLEQLEHVSKDELDKMLMDELAAVGDLLRGN